ncbi:protein of unknown function [Denitratisoma oestradiolicum]|uniref:Uncharacterized protein n=1 Tax=Denitratisoma oestradiolicum TaxID=311182 RepID=A0A6S6XUX2_9PROT|nr:protein of unknown function [Denitratisoma oestradiolicum]
MLDLLFLLSPLLLVALCLASLVGLVRTFRSIRLRALRASQLHCLRIIGTTDRINGTDLHDILLTENLPLIIRLQEITFQAKTDFRRAMPRD